MDAGLGARACSPWIDQHGRQNRSPFGHVSPNCAGRDNYRARSGAVGSLEKGASDLRGLG
jgi:hypothetical protein